MSWKYLLVITVFLYSCSGNSANNKAILSRQEMQDVLLDVMKADELISYKQEKDSNLLLLSKRVSIYDTIFSIHHINKEQFKNSLKYYQSRPDLLKVILDSIQVKVDSMKVPTLTKKLID